MGLALKRKKNIYPSGRNEGSKEMELALGERRRREKLIYRIFFFHKIMTIN